MSKRRTSIFFAILIACTGVFSCVRPVKFEGTSMEPALHDGDRLLIVTDVGELTRGDIIQFKYPQDQSRFYLKRIVGLPNEKIEIRSGVVLINGQAIDEPYLNAAQNKEESSFPEKVIPPDEFYVLGDNRVNSSDSRYWGTVKRELIIGKYHSKYASEK